MTKYKQRLSHNFIKAAFSLTLLFLAFFSFLPDAHATAYVWDNGGGDGLWATGANWNPDAPAGGPGAGDTVTFNNTSVANCTLNVANVTVAGFTNAGLYTGIFSTNNNNLTVNGNFQWNGGTFNAGSSTITVSGDWNSSGGTFTYGTSTVIMIGSGKTITTPAGGTRFYNLTIGQDSGASITANSNFNIANLLTISDTGAGTDTFTIAAGKTVGVPASGNLVVNTGGTLTILGSNAKFVRNVNDSSSHITNNGTITSNLYSSGFLWYVASGSTAAPITATNYNATVYISSDTYTTPLPSARFGPAGATFNTTKPVRFLYGPESEPYRLNILDNNTNNVNFISTSWLDIGTYFTEGTGYSYVIEFRAGSASYQFTNVTVASDTTLNAQSSQWTLSGNLDIKADGILTASSSTWTVGGNLTINAKTAAASVAGTLTANSSTWNVSGNWTNSGTFTAGSSTVTFDGTTDQTITTNGQPFYNLTLNNTGSSGSDDIIISGNLDVNGTLTITDGDFVLSTFNPNVNTAGNVTIGTNGSITKGSGTWTFDGTTTFTDTSSGGPQNLGTVVVN